MLEKLILFTVLMIITSIAMFLVDRNEKILQRRKFQTQELLRENILKKKLDKVVEKKVKFTKQYAIETLCLQAGYKLSYTEFLIISMISALITAIGVSGIMNNLFLGAMFLIIGWVAPKQFISFIKNQRLTRMEKQIGSFMQMVISRYETSKDFAKALELTKNEFQGEEPLYSELKQTVAEVKVGIPVPDAMDNLARRTGNKYMTRLSDYYKVASALGTEEVRKNLLNQAFAQFEENRKAKAMMKKELAGPVREAYIMLATIPMFALYQILTNPNYINFMTQTTMGKIGTTVISAVFMGSVWFVNAKIGAPID